MLKKSKKKAEQTIKVPATNHKFDKLALVDGTFSTIIPQRVKDKPIWQRPDPRKIFSFIPGTITSIDVAVGDHIKLGDKLLTFKAMKMSNTYNSPYAGRIATIDIAVGDIVSKGRLLLEFE